MVEETQLKSTLLERQSAELGADLEKARVDLAAVKEESQKTTEASARLEGMLEEAKGREQQAVEREQRLTGEVKELKAALDEARRGALRRGDACAASLGARALGARMGLASRWPWDNLSSQGCAAGVQQRLQQWRLDERHGERSGEPGHAVWHNACSARTPVVSPRVCGALFKKIWQLSEPQQHLCEPPQASYPAPGMNGSARVNGVAAPVGSASEAELRSLREEVAAEALAAQELLQVSLR